MAGNNDPIYSRRGSLSSGVTLKTAAADYVGQSIFNKEVFGADATNGSYLQRLRFKAIGTNVTTVARIYLNDGGEPETWGAAPGAPTGTPSTTGGTMIAGTTYYASIMAVDAGGRMTPLGTISAANTTTGVTGSIAWTWTAVSGAASYRIYVGSVPTANTDGLTNYFTSATNSFTQVSMHYDGIRDDWQVTNSKFYGEITLPATTASATAATPDIDYPMNIALPPGWEVYVGLGTTVAAGWTVMAIAGDY
jgi:hypothetical protein